MTTELKRVIDDVRKTIENSEDYTLFDTSRYLSKLKEIEDEPDTIEAYKRLSHLINTFALDTLLAVDTLKRNFEKGDNTHENS